ncbi:polysaccharide pyruvyl transferase family protein [Ralstonia sp. 25C]|uniref:polysaccharide pyruvyl transferase family protein n=1 Tax=Ralstonia sp. 25C TaxID=3447363 RepID=UPI003F75419A
MTDSLPLPCSDARIAASELVRAAYLALLSREPDESGYEHHLALLSHSGSVVDLLRAITDSEECRFLRFNDELPGIRRAVLEALRADVAGGADTDRVDTELNAVFGLVRELLASEEGWNAQVRNHSARIVSVVFQALLGRQPEPAALDAYEGLLRDTGDLTRCIEAVSGSDEHMDYLLGAHAKRGPSMHSVAYDAELIARCLERFAGRPATASEVAACLADPSPVGAALYRRLGAPVRRNAPRILIVGAYGNGNLGDVYQALAVRHHLKTAWGLPEDAIFAASLVAQSDYPFPEAQKLPANTLLDAEQVNSFDCVVVGGGGLLAHPHDPLGDADWVHGIHAPILLLGVGASGDVHRSHAELLARAWLVTGRDGTSVSALKAARADAVACLDPILGLSSVSPLTAFDLAVGQHPEPSDVLWILKYPANACDEALLRRISTYIQDHPTERHVVVALEPAMDEVLSAWLPGVPVIAMTSLSALMAQLRNTARVVSMRYHGAIFAALAGRYFVGCSQEKIRDLAAAWPSCGCYVEEPEALAARLSQQCPAVESLPFVSDAASPQTLLVAYQACV